MDLHPYAWLSACIAAAAGSAWFCFRNWSIARLIEDTPTSRLRSAAQGYVEFSGRALAAGDKPTPAPLTHLPCVWWKFRIEKKTGVGGRRQWSTVNSGSSEAPFRLDDGSGECLVQPQGADIRPASRDVWYGSVDWPAPPGAAPRFLSLGSEYRYTEYRIDVGSDVSVLGDYRAVGGVAETDIDGRLQRLLATWKQDQPELLRRFDANRDGVLSLGEWEQARRVARDLVERQALADQSPVTGRVGCPADGRPFLIAAGDLAALARRSRYAAAGLLLLFLGSVAGITVLAGNLP